MVQLQTKVHNLEKTVRLHLFYNGTGLRDYACIGAGARILSGLTSPTYTVQQRPSYTYKFWTYNFWRRHRTRRPALQSFGPEVAIFADMHLGSCWPMKGRTGSLGIALARPAVVTSFVIEHIPQQMSFRIDSAPRSGQLWGLTEIPLHPEEEELIRRGLLVSNATSVLPTPSHIPKSQLDQMLLIHLTVLVIKENWGHSEFTCLYRVRIHSDR
ncbi:hypothetical protein OH77DRAFT_1412913 [Trametes cingulata]|nr:hypothetical protein OH77DRAFT_1412913 [Trametes cingulata]